MLNRIIVLGMVALTLLGGGLFVHQITAPPLTGVAPGTATVQTGQEGQSPSQELSTSPTSPGTSSDSALPELDAYVRQAMESWNVPGTAIAVVKDDQVVFSKGYGVRNVKTEEPVTPRSLFAIGSTTKAFTTAALGMLVDEGKISWDDPVVDYLPDFRVKDPWITRHMTIRDLVTHRIGLKRADLLWYANNFDRDEVLERVGKVEHTLRFRDQFGYQNIMYTAAGEIVRAVTGTSWSTFVRNRILSPLNMVVSNTSTDQLSYYSNVATPHVQSGSEALPIDYRNIDVAAPAGAINANVQEMAQWVRLQLNEGTFEGEQLLKPATVREMHSPETIIDMGPLGQQINPETQFSTYGLGWFVEDYRGHKVASHGGNIDGMSANVTLVPEEELGIVVLTNQNATPLPEVLRKWIADRYLDAPDKDWSQVYQQVYEQIEAQQRQALQRVRDKRAEGTELSLPLERYAGIYESDVYGELTIRPEGDGLVLRYGDFVGDLSHWHHDTFRLGWRDPALGGEGSLFFANAQLNARGEIESLKVHDALGQLDLGEFQRVGDVEQP